MKSEINCVLLVFVVLIGSTSGRSGLHSEQSAPPARVQHCREGCLEKFATEDFACLQGPECSMCWNECVSPSSKINTPIRDTWILRTVSMVRQGSLVSADIRWPASDDPTQCLVTWEVSSGGLMGNLLTDLSSVELSLWPETKYKVQVTCKNKVTEAMTRSLPLTLDTNQALTMEQIPTISSSSSSSDEDQTTTELNNNIPLHNNNNNHHHDVDVNTDIKNDLSSTVNQNRLNQQQNRVPIRPTTTTKTTSTTTTTKTTASNQDTDDDDNDGRDNELIDKNRLWKLFSSTENHNSNHQSEMIFGLATAILVFSVILFVFIVNLKKTNSSDKVTLIDNEISNNNNFDSNNSIVSNFSSSTSINSLTFDTQSTIATPQQQTLHV